MDLFEVGVKDVGEIAIIKCKGDIDAYTAPSLRTQAEQCLSKGHNRLIFVLEGPYCDSSGISVFVHFFKATRKNKGDIALVIGSNQPNVRKVLEITGLDKVIKICETEEDALDFLSKQQPNAA